MKQSYKIESYKLSVAEKLIGEVITKLSPQILKNAELSYTVSDLTAAVGNIRQARIDIGSVGNE